MGFFAPSYRRRASGAPPPAFDPATLDMSLWLDSRDYVPATYPAAFTWHSRASAGDSGLYTVTRNLYVSPGATANPGTATVSGKQVAVLSGAESCIVALKTTPGTAAASSAFLGSDVAKSWALSAVVMFPVVTNGPTSSPNSQPMPFGPAGGAGGAGFRATTGPYVTCTQFDSEVTFGYQHVDASISLSVLVLVQAEYNRATGVLRIRSGSGPWVTLSSVGSNAMTANFMLFASQLSGPDFTGRFAELMTFRDQVFPAGVADGLKTLAATNWGT